MINFARRVRYAIMTKFNIHAAERVNPHCEMLFTENFRNLNRWATTQPETVKYTRPEGVTLSFKQIDTKNFVSPCIISYTTIEGGSVTIETKFNPHPQIVQYFLLRHKSQEIGFKVTNGKAYVICPHINAVGFTLRNYDRTHLLEIEIEPETSMIHWRIDNIKVFSILYPSLDLKHLMIGMSALKGKLSPKDLPISFSVHSVRFLSNNCQHLKRNP